MLLVHECLGDLQFITINTLPHCDEPVSRMYDELIDFINRQHGVLLYERVFGSSEFIQTLLRTRNEKCRSVFNSHYIEPTVIVRNPLYGDGFAGLQAAVLKQGTAHSVDCIKTGDTTLGFLGTGAEAQYCVLNDASRCIPAPPSDGAKETQETLEFLNRTLMEHNWNFKDVCRTWFYLTDILNWYNEFNQTRNTFFTESGLINHISNPNLPASTGIQGQNIRDGWCTLDLLAVKPLPNKPLHISRLNNSGQNEAPEYGSAFSRGMSVTTESSKYAFISGTASIDEYGKSIHTGDFEQQVIETVEKVKTLLQPINFTLDDICQGTVFVKRQQDVDAYNKISAQLGLDRLPMVCVLADVCRDELLFEIDAIAYQPING